MKCNLRKFVKLFFIAVLISVPSFAVASSNRIGVQAGTNMETMDGYAFTCGAHADTEILEGTGLLVGMQMDFSVDSVSWSSNPSMYVEYLLPFTFFNVMTPFVKGNLGMFVLHNSQTGTLHQSGVVASASAGLNISFGEHFYVAPAVSFGYPFLWAADVSAGWRF